MVEGPNVAVVVLNWNGWEDTKACVKSIQELRYTPRQVYIVDNGSTDGSPQRLHAAFPDVTLLRLRSNLGYGGGMNAGIRAALEEQSDFILCVNNDMTFDSDFLEPLVQAAEGGGVIPFPAIHQGEDPGRIDSAGNRLSYTGLTSPVGHGAKEVPTRVEADYTELPLLARRLLERIGLYKEEYFAFYEDADLSLRIRGAGWDLRLVPESRVYHRRGSTTRRIPGLTLHYSLRNRLLVIRDNGTRGRWLLTAFHVLFLTLPFQLLKVLANPTSKHSPRHLLSGLVDGLLPWRRGIVRRWPPPT